MTSFDDIGSGEEDEEDEHRNAGIDAKSVGSLHFGGGLVRAGEHDGEEGGEQRRRSRKEIMEEVVMKAKKHKMERQELKRKAETLTEQVDSELASIRALLSTGAPELPRDAAPKGGKDNYDTLVRELAYEAKARATDRIKTPAEVAAAEHERLQRLEAERLRRYVHS